MTRTLRPDFFAPQAQLVDVETNRVIGIEEPNPRAGNDARTGAGASSRDAGTSRTRALDPDVSLMKADVTLTHHGSGNFEVVLNNQRNNQGRPIYPPWKYNDLAQIKFGQRLRLDVRYANEPWTPLILARVTDLKFAFPQSGVATLTVIGDDLISLLKIRPTADKRYEAGTTEIDILRDILRRSNTESSLPFVTDSSRRHPAFLSSGGEALPRVIHRKDQTYFQFLDELAKRLDFELFVVPGESREEPASAGEQAASGDGPRYVSQLHFEPARSLVTTPSQVIDLIWGKNLTHFSPTFKVWDLYTQAVAQGRHPQRRERVTAERSRSEAVADVQEDLSHLPGDPRPIDAISLRDRYFDREPSDNQVSVNVSHLGPERALLKAQAALRAKARQFLTVSGSTIGFPLLRPGTHINVCGLYAPFDGLYYVTKTVHTIGENGYQTAFTARRPGMLEPALYPGGAATPAGDAPPAGDESPAGNEPQRSP